MLGGEVLHLALPDPVLAGAGSFHRERPLDQALVERLAGCDLGRVASVLVSGGLTAVEELRVSPGNPVRAMLAQRLSEAPDILARLGGRCAAEYKYDGVRVQAHRTADGAIELYTRRLERVSSQFPDVVEALAAGLGPREAIVEGAVKRLRPKVMTVGVMFMGLLPIMWSHGTGADVMKRIAAPMIGGIFTSFLLELVVYPAIYEVWKWHSVKRQQA